MNVVRRDGRNAELAGDLRQRSQDDLLLFDPVVLQFDVIAVPENAFVPERDLFGLGVRLGGKVPPVKGSGEFPRQASRKADEPLVVLLDQFPVDPRFVVESLFERARREDQKVVEPRLVHRQQGQVAVRVFHRAGLVGAAPRGDVRLVAGDRLDPLRFALQVELERAVHVPVVGQRQGGHSELFGPFDQAVDLSRAVQKRIVGMDVQMGEGDEFGVGLLR